MISALCTVLVAMQRGGTTGPPQPGETENEDDNTQDRPNHTSSYAIHRIRSGEQARRQASYAGISQLVSVPGGQPGRDVRGALHGARAEGKGYLKAGLATYGRQLKTAAEIMVAFQNGTLEV